MPSYRAYPTKKTERNRMTRKRDRRTIFEYNKNLFENLRKEKRKARRKTTK